MQRVLQKIYLSLQSCLNCGSQVRISELLLCPDCQEKILFYSDQDQGIDRLSLYTWIPNRSSIVSRVVMNLKGHHYMFVYLAYADLLLERAKQKEIRISADTIIVPAPPRRTGDRDHAHHLAEAISLRTGCVLALALERESAEMQKNLSRQERQKSQMKLHEKFTQDAVRGRGILFVDDIITTGATARAAWLALGSPKRFHIWTLANRSSLAEKPPLLV
ncbi:MAG: hypothetical protein BroJett040_08740 [Oligoflexia bacterium]|nr:MAG: hypothetical protein BroJett040_08740 [Oligoflexia bacterium]